MPDTNSAAETPLNERLKAVWLTYRTRPMMWCVAGIAGVVVAFSLFAVIADSLDGKSPPPRVRQGFSLFTGIAAVVIAAGVGLHAKSQFVSPRARLLPGYRPAHTRALRWISIAALVVYPFFVALTLNLSLLGTVALALLSGAGIVWTFHNPLTVFPLLVVFLSLYDPRVASFWLNPHLSSWPLHLPLLAFGGWALLRWLRRLDEMHEECADYSIPPIAAAFSRPSRNERAEQRKLAAKQFGKGASWNDGPVDRALARGSLSCYALMRLTLIPGPTWFRGLFMVTMFSSMPMLMSALLGKAPADFFFMPVVMSVYMPGMVASQAADLKRRQLEAELLRPVGRRAYYSNLFRAMFAEVAILGAIFTAVTALFIALFAPDLITSRRVVVYLALAPATNLLFVAAGLWMAARYSGLFRLVIQGLLIMVVAIVGGLSVVEPGTLPGIPASLPVVVGAAILAVGVLVLRSAYGRWLSMEVG